MGGKKRAGPAPTGGAGQDNPPARSLKNPAEEQKEPGPVRTCLGCGKKRQKSSLHRLVLDERHQPVLDRTKGAPGRGAYVCGPGCLEAALKRKAFQRAFRGNAALDELNLEAFLQQLDRT